MRRSPGRTHQLVGPESASALRIVYAEDDEQVRTTITDLLACLGVDVHVCGNGAEAVLLCLSVKPDVALLDLTMPGMDGFEGAVRIRQNDVGREITLVALTGHMHESYRDQARKAGFDEFLAKPVTMEILEDAVGRWCRGPRVRSQSRF